MELDFWDLMCQIQTRRKHIHPNEDTPKAEVEFPGANCLQEFPIASDALDPKYPKPKDVFPVGADDPNALYALEYCPNAGLENALLTGFPNRSDVFSFALF